MTSGSGPPELCRSSSGRRKAHIGLTCRMALGLSASWVWRCMVYSIWFLAHAAYFQILESLKSWTSIGTLKVVWCGTCFWLRRSRDPKNTCRDTGKWHHHARNVLQTSETRRICLKSWCACFLTRYRRKMKTGDEHHSCHGQSTKVKSQQYSMIDTETQETYGSIDLRTGCLKSVMC